MRSITSHTPVDTGLHIVTISHGTEFQGARVMSIKDKTASHPAVRVLSDGRSCPLEDEEHVAGLIVYGTHKFDRPSIEAMEIKRPDVDWTTVRREVVC